jgi:hypothetical protein
MKTEEVKYVYQSEGPLLAKTKNGSVYQETTVSGSNNRAKDVKHCCWPSHLFSRLRLILSCLAIVSCLVVIAVNNFLFVCLCCYLSFTNDYINSITFSLNHHHFLSPGNIDFRY